MSVSSDIDPKVYGKIKFTGKDMPCQPVRFNQLAIGAKKELLFVSVVAEPMIVKAIRAIVVGGARADIEVQEGGQVKVPGDTSSYLIDPRELVKVEEGYEVHTHKLRYGMIHAMFVSRSPGFMKVLSDEALWQELTQTTRYTTPILREWLPYVAQNLRNRDILRVCRSFNVKCGELIATDEQLDEIVSGGLKLGYIKVPGAKLAPIAN